MYERMPGLLVIALFYLMATNPAQACCPTCLCVPPPVPLGCEQIQTTPTQFVCPSGTSPGHPSSNQILNVNAADFKNPSDVGGWNYSNVSSDNTYGSISVNCGHRDMRGFLWNMN